MTRIRNKRLVAGLAGGLTIAATTFAAQDIRGQVEWPTTWVVFAPAERDAPPPPPEVLRDIPAHFALPDGTVLEPNLVDAPPGARIDLADFFETAQIGNTAWLFATLESAREQAVTLGMGADWWFTAWLNGEEVLSTPEAGNHHWPPGPGDHTAEVTLRAGPNTLAVRVITGSASALFAAGGPAEIRAVRAAIGGAEDPLRFNRPVPFDERRPFAFDRQAYASAEMRFDLPPPEVDLSTGALTGLQPLPKRQVRLSTMYDRPAVHDVEYRRFPYDPVKLLLSKTRYPFEDRHLDIVLWTSPPEDVAHDGSLEIVLRDADGAALSRQTIETVSETGWFFALGFPDALAGRAGSVEAVWRQGDTEIGRTVERFSVLPPAEVARAGRIPVRVLNETGATLRNAPMTTGVPFPHGALDDPAQVWLLDEDGAEIPMQAKVAGRWSRFGPIKWLLCDFTVDLDGGPRELVLAFGRRASGIGGRASLAAESTHTGFPVIDAGRLRFGPDGLWFDAVGDGTFARVLDAAALEGAFVEHEDGRVFRPDPATPFVIEEAGPEKIVVRRAGWYVSVGSEQWTVDSGQLAVGSEQEAVDSSRASGVGRRESSTGTRFCNYVTRFVIHRNSPAVRIYHTWIFTGDGNRDRIRNMGWRFPTAQPLAPEGIVTAANGADVRWTDADHLVQFDFDRYLTDGRDDAVEGRTPGIAAARVGDARLTFGVKDFWQNFPSELAFDDQALVFYNWPRRNPPAFTPRPYPAGEAFRLRYAHEGELLDFRTPEEYVDGDIWEAAGLGGRDAPWPQGDRDFINAQGVARTEEMLLLFDDAGAPRDAAVPAQRGYDTETLRAVVDPVWMAASGAFERIHHQDFENYPREETLYSEICHAPARWNERLGAYGMWVHGDFPVDSANLQNRTASPRRTWKKGHHGWPYKFMPYARSGDPRLLKYAEAGTRQMVDGNFKHFVDSEVVARDTLGQGWTGTSLFPWHGSSLRGISHDVDYLWHNWYLTGFQRPRDVALLWMELVKLSTHQGLRGRISVSQMHYYLDTYKATFDPWFLIAAHETGNLHLAVFDGEVPDTLSTDTVGHFWKPSQYDFYRFTGDENHARVAKRIALTWSSPWAYTKAWNRLDVPFIEESAQAWFLTGDPYHLGRIRGQMDSAAIQVFDGLEPEYLRGSSMRSGGAGTALELFTGWYIQHFPLGLYALATSGLDPDPIPEPFFQRPVETPSVTIEDTEYHRVAAPTTWIRHDAGGALPIFLDTWRYQDLTYDYRVRDADGRTVLEGQWTAQDIARIDLPADTPPGLYRLDMDALDTFTGWRAPASQFVSGLNRIPVTLPEVPEVFGFERTDEGTRIGSAVYEAQYWFQVPEGLDRFRVRFVRGGAKVWNPAGEVVWCAWRDDPADDTVEIDVPPGQDGRLWRITRPGASQGLILDPRIPPWFSISRAKWFNPEE